MNQNTTERERLIAYASGCGAISLTYQRGDRATSRTVTLRDARRYLTTKRGQHLAAGGYQARKVNGQTMLVSPVTRTGPDRLSIPSLNDGHPKPFRYEVDTCGDPPRIYSVRLFFVSEIDLREHEVKNLSLLGRARFFLDHEAQLQD